MANLIISYPTISDEDYVWIQGIREHNDSKHFELVKPHVTLVFGTDKLDANELFSHANNVVHGFKKIEIVLDSVQVVKNDLKTFYQAFLVPSKGYDEIIRCHDLLYTGPMKSELREDIPFIPHVGIGMSSDEAEMNELAEKVNSQKISITGFLDELTIIEYDGNQVTEIQKLSLA